MRAKILTSLLIIALASALAGGATFAVFTHREAIENNFISTGDLDFRLVGTPFEVSNMKPGDKIEGYIEIANTGSLDMIFKISIVPDDEITTPGFAGQLLATVTLNPEGYVSQDYPHFGKYGPANYAFPKARLSDVIALDMLHNEQATFEDGEPLKPGFVAVYKVEIELPLETTSEWENAIFKCDVIVDGTQADHQTPGNVIY